MITCPECDPRFTAVCDFCKHFDFNGEDRGGKHGTIYVDKGYCNFHKRRTDPEKGCSDFHCEWADKGVK